MRRLLPLLLAFTLACGLFTPAAPTPEPTRAVPTASSAPILTATLAATITPAPTLTPAPTSTLLADSIPTATPTADPNFTLKPEHVRFHPVPRLYSGDIVSVEVVAEGAPRNWQGAPVWVYLGSRASAPLDQATFSRFGLGGRMQATFTWAWNTGGLVGPQTLVVVVGPVPAAQPPLAEQSVTVMVDLLPPEDRPMPEPLAEWATAENECCVFHYLTGTAAERDLAEIMATAEAAFAHVEDVLGVDRTNRVVFNLLSRLLGHGGFASAEISLTYIDRNPAGSDLFNLFAHEATHLLDRKFAQVKPTLMTEGLAVFVAGGHFKTENLERRAAALLALDRYIPLEELANDFYPAQHEIGYLEGGAFIAYLVARFGWPRFKALYASFQSAPTDAQMLDKGLQVHFGQSLAELEADWLAHLRTLPRNPAEIDDLRLTIELYDTLRRYQQAMDPSAYFLTAWLPDGPRARERQIRADFVRHPDSAEHVALEAMLQAAGQHLLEGDAAGAGELLAAVNAALDAGSLSASALAGEYLAVVQALRETGYEAQTIRLENASAEVTAIRDWPQLDELSLMRAAGGWRVLAPRVEGLWRPPSLAGADGIMRLWVN